MNVSDTPQKPNKTGALTGDTQKRLGRELRAMYAEILAQGVPDRINNLLAQVCEADKQ